MKPTVVIADDVQSFREKLYLWLQEEFKIVEEAADGVAALEAIKRNQPDIVIIDIVMPKMSGIEVLRKIKEQMKDPPIRVVVSGLGDAVIQALEAGANEFLLKPVDPKKLISTLRSLLKQQKE